MLSSPSEPRRTDPFGRRHFPRAVVPTTVCAYELDRSCPPLTIANDPIRTARKWSDWLTRNFLSLSYQMTKQGPSKPSIILGLVDLLADGAIPDRTGIRFLIRCAQLQFTDATPLPGSGGHWPTMGEIYSMVPMLRLNEPRNPTRLLETLLGWKAGEHSEELIQLLHHETRAMAQERRSSANAGRKKSAA